MQTSDKKVIGITVGMLLLTLGEFWAVAAYADFARHNLGVFIGLFILSVAWIIGEAFALALLPVWPARVLIVLPVIVIALAGSSSSFAIVGGLLCGLALWWSQYIFSREMTSRITWQTRTAMKAGTEMIMVALLIAIIGLSLPATYVRIGSRGLTTTGDEIAVVLRPAEPILRNMLPGYTSDATLDEIIRARVQQEVGAVAVSSSESKAITGQVLRNLGQQLRQPVQGHESVSDVVSKVINARIADVTRTHALAITALLGLLTLLALRALVPLLAWPVLALLSGWLIIAQSTGLVALTEVQVQAQKLHL